MKSKDKRRTLPNVPLKHLTAVCLILTVAIMPLALAFSPNSAQGVQAAAAWDIRYVDSEGYAGRDTSIGLDSLGNPHISYWDYSNSDLKYAKWNGSAWNIKTVDSEGSVGAYTSIALDSLDRPHISYIGSGLKYARWVPNAWLIQTVDSVSLNCGFSSIALDSANRPHISYSGDFGLKYTWWNGSAWSVQTVELGGGTCSSIALDSDDNPCISYYDYTNYDLKYAWWTGSAWSIQTVDSAGEVGRDTSLALDSSNTPHISYYDDTNGNLKYAWRNGTAWVIKVVDKEGDVGGYSSIALDSNDSPAISYYDYTNKDLKCAYFSGSFWYRVTVDSAGDVGSEGSLALDSNNFPHISYNQFGLGSNYLKYAFYTDVDFSLAVSPAAQTVAAGDSATHATKVTLVSGSPGNVLLSLDGLPPSVGTYTFTPQSATPTFTSKLTITTISTAPPGTYNLKVTATSPTAVIEQVPLTLVVTAPQSLTLNLSPQPVARGAPLIISGQLTPGKAVTIRLYCRNPHQTGVWKLGTTFKTNSAGAYSVVATVPTSLSPGQYDLRAVWFNEADGSYAASPINLLTIT